MIYESGLKLGLIENLHPQGCVDNIEFDLPRARKPKSVGFPAELETLSDHIRAKRMSLGLHQRELAEMLSVTTSCVENWERKRSDPHYHHYPSITKFLGYALIKHHPIGGWRQTLLNDRLQKGLARYQYAKLIEIDENTLRRAELGQKLIHRSKCKIYRYLCTLTY